MFDKKLLSSKTASASFVAKLTFVFLVSMQSISIAHDLSHHEHEASEVCQVLNAFGANKDIAPLDTVTLFDFNSNTQIKVVYSSLADRSIHYIQRSRSPPPYSL